MSLRVSYHKNSESRSVGFSGEIKIIPPDQITSIFATSEDITHLKEVLAGGYIELIERFDGEDKNGYKSAIRISEGIDTEGDEIFKRVDIYVPTMPLFVDEDLLSSPQTVQELGKETHEYRRDYTKNGVVNTFATAGGLLPESNEVGAGKH